MSNNLTRARDIIAETHGCIYWEEGKNPSFHYCSRPNSYRFAGPCFCEEAAKRILEPMKEKA